MAKTKLKKAVMVTTVLEESQHEALRFLSYTEKISMAELLRQAVNELLKKREKEISEQNKTKTISANSRAILRKALKE